MLNIVHKTTTTKSNPETPTSLYGKMLRFHGFTTVIPMVFSSVVPRN